MMGFAIATLHVVVLGCLVWLTVEALEGSVLAGAVAIGLVIVMLGAGINASIKEDEKGPCHQYETRMMYNTAAKTMMQSRACVLRGECVEEGHDNQ